MMERDVNDAYLCVLPRNHYRMNHQTQGNPSIHGCYGVFRAEND